MIHIQCKFQRILCICYLVTDELETLQGFKNDNSCTAGDILTKFYVHSHIILMHIY